MTKVIKPYKLKRSDTAWVAYIPEHNIAAQGKTKKAAITNLITTLVLIYEGLMERMKENV